MKQTLFILICMGPLAAQTMVDLRNQSKNVDFSQAVSTTPWKVGAATPTTCTPGAAFFNTTAPAGANVYVCTATNTWTLASGSSGTTFTSGSGAPGGTCSSGSFYFDTTNLDTWVCGTNGSWKKALTTNNTGPFRMTGQNGGTPAAADTGNTSLFFSSTAKVGQTIDDTGGVATMVRPVDCSGAAQFVQTVTAAGTLVCAGGVSTVSRSFTPVAGTSSNPISLWYNGGVPAICDSGSNGWSCYLHWYEDGATNSTAVIGDSVPDVWTSGNVHFTLRYRGTGSAVQWSVATACQGNGSADPPSFNAPQNLASTPTSSGLLYATTLTGVTMTGCSAGQAIYFRIRRVDTTGYVNLTGASVGYTLQ
jgi:hypothetical protein